VARMYCMTWINPRKQSMKMDRGRRSVISRRALNCPKTNQASCQAANRWRSAKRAGLGGYTVPPAKPGSPAPGPGGGNRHD
jgi:hypothetical protein